MSTLLMHLAGNRIYNKVIFRPHLYIFDDRIVYKKKHWIKQDEIAITYNHISQINIYKFIVRFAHLEIVTTAPQTIHCRWISKKKALKAKAIIDEKVYRAHKQHSRERNNDMVGVGDFELSLKRLNELVVMGKLSERDFKKRKKELLKKHY